MRVPHSSFRVRRSSVGSSITQMEARSSEEYSIAQKVAAWLRGGCVALRAHPRSGRLQRRSGSLHCSSEVCSVAQKLQRSS